MKTPIRMKQKSVTKVHLGMSGKMEMSAKPVSSDAASKGISAQPANPLTEAENKGNPGPAPSQKTSNTSEQGTGAPEERVSPGTKPEADKQPAMKDLEQSPSQDPKSI